MSERPNPLLGAHRFLRRGPVSEENWSQLVAKDRDWERSYRGRWEHQNADLPDNEAAAATALAVNASGGVAIKTVVLLTPEEVDAAAERAVSYRAPGN